jgi:hypothetical protein
VCSAVMMLLSDWCVYNSCNQPARSTCTCVAHNQRVVQVMLDPAPCL